MIARKIHFYNDERLNLVPRALRVARRMTLSSGASHAEGPGDEVVRGLLVDGPGR